MKKSAEIWADWPSPDGILALGSLVMWRNFRYREILDVEKFEMWRYIRCREILDVEQFQMWRFFRCKEKYDLHCFAVRSVLLPCMLFCRKICSFEIYAVLLQNLFCRNSRTFYVEKNWAQNFVRGEKMTNIMYDHALIPLLVKEWKSR